MMSILKRVAALGAAIAMSACGGGGSDAGTSPFGSPASAPTGNPGPAPGGGISVVSSGVPSQKYMSISIETYKLGDVYHCTIANVDPGARFARAAGATREEAETRALEKATKYLAQTRRFPTA